jgi:hypothetical protein
MEERERGERSDVSTTEKSRRRGGDGEPEVSYTPISSKKCCRRHISDGEQAGRKTRRHVRFGPSSQTALRRWSARARRPNAHSRSPNTKRWSVSKGRITRSEVTVVGRGRLRRARKERREAPALSIMDKSRCLRLLRSARARSTLAQAEATQGPGTPRCCAQDTPRGAAMASTCCEHGEAQLLEGRRRAVVF